MWKQRLLARKWVVWLRVAQSNWLWRANTALLLLGVLGYFSHLAIYHLQIQPSSSDVCLFKPNQEWPSTNPSLSRALSIFDSVWTYNFKWHAYHIKHKPRSNIGEIHSFISVVVVVMQSDCSQYLALLWAYLIGTSSSQKKPDPANLVRENVGNQKVNYFPNWG